MKRALLAMVLLALAVPLNAQDATDPYRNSDFDGHWTGTVRIGGVETPLAVNLSVDGDVALARVMLPDVEDRAQSFGPFPTEVKRLKRKRTDLVVDSGREGRKADEITLILKYKKGSDTLRVKAKGALRGRGDLRRSDPERPLRAIWGGDLLVALDESADDAVRFAVTEISGFSWSEDPDIQGPIAGTRSGSDVAFTIETRGGDLEFAGQLRDADTELRGDLSLGAGNPGNVSMTRASGHGPLQVRKFAPDSVGAGETTAVMVTGRNLAEGLVVDTDVEGVSVTGVTVDSATKATVSVTVDRNVPDGTAVGLRVRNADGQASISPRALTIVAGTGGGPPPGLLSFAADVEPILGFGCGFNNCHTAQSPNAGLVLVVGQVYDNIVNVPSTQQPNLMRIQPGDADASYLVRKIRGDEGITGGRMPRDGPGLTEAEIQTIIDWVNQGAANNRLPR